MVGISPASSYSTQLHIHILLVRVMCKRGEKWWITDKVTWKWKRRKKSFQLFYHVRYSATTSTTIDFNNIPQHLVPPSYSLKLSQRYPTIIISIWLHLDLMTWLMKIKPRLLRIHVDLITSLWLPPSTFFIIVDSVFFSAVWSIVEINLTLIIPSTDSPEVEPISSLIPQFQFTKIQPIRSYLSDCNAV